MMTWDLSWISILARQKTKGHSALSFSCPTFCSAGHPEILLLCTLDQWRGSLQAHPGKKSLQELTFPCRSSNSNHKVGFHDARRTGQSWLKYDSINNTMLCSLCSKHWVNNYVAARPFNWILKVVEHKHILEMGIKNIIISKLNFSILLSWNLARTLWMLVIDSLSWMNECIFKWMMQQIKTLR